MDVMWSACRPVANQKWKPRYLDLTSADLRTGNILKRVHEDVARHLSTPGCAIHSVPQSVGPDEAHRARSHHFWIRRTRALLLFGVVACLYDVRRSIMWTSASEGDSE